MVSNPKFLEHARKLIDDDERLRKLKGEGKLSREQYQKQREELYTRLERIKQVNLKLIEGRLADLEADLTELKNELEGGELSEEDYDLRSDKLERMKSELEPEKDIIELYENEEYIRHIQDYLVADRFNRIESYKLISEGKGGNRPPVWAWAIAAFLAGFTAIMGLLAGSPLHFFLGPITVAATIAFAVFMLHLATVLAGVINSSYIRAFTTLMKNIGLNAIAYAALALYILVFMRPAAYTGFNIFSLLVILGGLRVAVYGVGVLVFAYCVRSVYDTSWLRAAAVVTANIFIVVVVRFILGSLCVGCG